MLQLAETHESRRIIKKNVKALQVEECKKHEGKTPKGSFVAKLQSAADRNAKNAVTSDPLITALYDPDTSKTLTQRDASKITSIVASNNRGITPKGSFAALVQSAADKAAFYKEHDDPISMYLESTGPQPVTKEMASTIQSKDALLHDGKITKGSFAALAQSAADKREAAIVDQNADLQQQFLRSRHPISKEKESKIQSSVAKKRGGRTKKGSIVARSQSEADRALAYGSESPTAVNSEITARPELKKSSRESFPTH